MVSAKKIFVKKGIIGTATSQIAKDAGIAHGTLFLHFPSKETLIMELLDEELSKFSDRIRQLISDTSDIKLILNNYLDIIQEEEGFFASLAKELPYYKSELRRKILFRESLIREHFQKAIKIGIENGIYSQIDIASTLIFLFGTINYYLSLKKSFVQDGSVIKKYRHQIVENFMKMLIIKGKENG